MRCVQTGYVFCTCNNYTITLCADMDCRVAFESPRFPKIWEGRWSDGERYTTEDMCALIVPQWTHTSGFSADDVDACLCGLTCDFSGNPRVMPHSGLGWSNRRDCEAFELNWRSTFRGTPLPSARAIQVRPILSPKGNPVDLQCTESGVGSLVHAELCVNASGGRDGHCGLNPARNFTFEFVDGLVGELAAPTSLANGSESPALFPERFFHFGGCVMLCAWTRGPFLASSDLSTPLCPYFVVMILWFDFQR